MRKDMSWRKGDLVSRSETAGEVKIGDRQKGEFEF
jgi:hypothetical protein